MLINLGVVPDGPSRAQTRRAFWCFLAVSFSMLLNFFLAVLNTHGVGMSEGKVTIIQILVTALSGCLLLPRITHIRAVPAIMLGLLVVLLITMNLLKTPNPKAFYDCLIVPLYIGIGASAYGVRDKWMSWLFWFVVIIVALEALLPTIYTAIVNAGDYFRATRAWWAARLPTRLPRTGFTRALTAGAGPLLLT
jgi:hypothetical protein